VADFSLGLQLGVLLQQGCYDRLIAEQQEPVSRVPDSRELGARNHNIGT
jgi:hypothetical protein